MSWEENRVIARLAWGIFLLLCVVTGVALVVFLISLEIFWLLLAALLLVSAFIFKSYARLSFSDIKNKP